MTDEQIIKALECCSQENKCQECPYGTACLDEKYISIISKDVLDLINRQKAEIEWLKWSKSTSLKEFAEKVKPIIEEMVDVMFDDNISRCFINNCKKPTSITCESKICIEENKAFWTAKIDSLLKEIENETEKKENKPASMGEINSNSEKEKEFYSSAEVDKLTKKQLSNPKIMNAVMKSMLKW